MKRMLLAGVIGLAWVTTSMAQTCDTLGGNAPGCGTKRGGPAVQSKGSLSARDEIQFGPANSKVVGRTSDEDDRIKASIGGLTTHSDGRQCLQIGLSVNCVKGPAR